MQISALSFSVQLQGREILVLPLENKYRGQYLFKLTHEFWPSPKIKNNLIKTKNSEETISLKTAPEIKGLHPSGNLKV